jgi:hypothetical protein
MNPFDTLEDVQQDELTYVRTFQHFADPGPTTKTVRDPRRPQNRRSHSAPLDAQGLRHQTTIRPPPATSDKQTAVIVYVSYPW